jgi:hypothetical protein
VTSCAQISGPIENASATPAIPNHAHNQERRFTLTKESFTPAKDLSNLESLTSNFQNPNRYTKRLETGVSYRKQTLGTVLIGTDPVLVVRRILTRLSLRELPLFDN